MNFNLKVFDNTDVENFDYNRVILSGTVIKNIQFVFETKKTRFYRTVLCVKRNKDKRDTISILFNETTLKNSNLKRGDYVKICGYLRCSDRIIFNDESASENLKMNLRNTERINTKPDFVEKLIRFTDVFVLQILEKNQDKDSEKNPDKDLKRSNGQSDMTDTISDAGNEQSDVDNEKADAGNDNDGITAEHSDTGNEDSGVDLTEDVLNEESNKRNNQKEEDLNLIEICGTVIQKSDVKVFTYESDDSKVRHRKALACSIKINPGRKDNSKSDKNSHFLVSCIFWGKMVNVIRNLPNSYSVRLLGKIENVNFSNYHNWIDSSYVISSYRVTEIKYVK